MNIQEKINLLKFDLSRQILSNEEIFQRHIVDGNTYFFQNVVKDISREYQTKSIIAEYLGVHIHEIIFVGSAKLGYSLNPRNLFNHFDNKYSQTKNYKDKSDIDIAIVSNTLFEQISKGIFEFTDSFETTWTTNIYNPIEKPVPLYYKYFKYFSKGWFRPDLKPEGYEFCMKNSFEELKRELYGQFKRKAGIGIYKDWHYFKYYHINNIKNLSFRGITETL